jgi:hypothetical protein
LVFRLSLPQALLLVVGFLRHREVAKHLLLDVVV